MEKKINTRRKPDWLKIRLPEKDSYKEVKQLIKDNNLHTICTSGSCPNLGECWDAGTATFMILGDICTRACKFCAVTTGKPLNVDKNEPIKLARSIKALKLKHCVITSVDRDDLPDGGASIWAETITEIKKLNPETTIEVLIPDFQGNTELVDIVIGAKPNVISHNMETVRRLTPKIRTKAKYNTSLKVLEHIAKSGIRAKSGIMLGIGETFDEVLQTMDDLRAVNCEVLTIGQYLQPTKQNMEVEEYVKPEIFSEYKKLGLEKGFRFVESSPLVRSSYHAEKHVL
ncbi:MAG: lipoyl synthase [Bacteroidales bacterium]|nr:lipoyl synthase [Bacteroidales bacterium]MBN2758030.1 lipoyl synthase [Bacteroidales bacterium]